MEENVFYVEFSGRIFKVCDSEDNERDGNFSIYTDGSRISFNNFKCFLGEARIIEFADFNAESETISKDSRVMYNGYECIIVTVREPNCIVFVHKHDYSDMYDAITIYTGAEFDKNSEYTKQNILPKIKIVKDENFKENR